MPGTATITIGEKEWAVDVAISPEELTAGLGGVASIPAQTGMLFDLGSEQTVQVTTEPMLFSIDVIFISEDLKVVDIVDDVAPGNIITEETPVRYFIEVNTGEAIDIEVGDDVEITDYQYSPPSAIAGMMPSIIQIAMIGFVSAMMSGMMSGMAEKPKCVSCGSKIEAKEIHYKTPKGIYCSRCVPSEYRISKYVRAEHSPSPKRVTTESEKDIKKLEKMAECLALKSEVTGISPETVGEYLAEAEAIIPSWYKGGERTKALTSKAISRTWLYDRAKEYGCIGSGSKNPGSAKREEGWIYSKVGSTEMRGKKTPTGIYFEQVSPSYNKEDLDKAVKYIEDALQHTAYVTCPICHKAIEIPKWDKVTRSGALLEHIEKEHKATSINLNTGEIKEYVEHHSIHGPERRRLVDAYGTWAVGRAEAVCAEGDIACVEKEAGKLIKAYRGEW